MNQKAMHTISSEQLCLRMSPYRNLTMNAEHSLTPATIDRTITPANQIKKQISISGPGLFAHQMFCQSW